MAPWEIIELSDSEPDESKSYAGAINNAILVATTRIELLKKTLVACQARLPAAAEDVRVAQENLDEEQERKPLLFNQKFLIKDEPQTPQGLQLVGPPPARPPPPPPTKWKTEVKDESPFLPASPPPPTPPTAWKTQVKDESPFLPASPAPEESPLPSHPPCRVKRDPSAEAHPHPFPNLYTPDPPPTANGEDAETEPFIIAMAKVPLSDKFRDVPHDAHTFIRIHISSIVGGQPQGAWPTPDPKKNWQLKIGDYCCF
ncbi:hypothetical protein RUND412_003705 [Rhizina undulata]